MMRRHRGAAHPWRGLIAGALLALCTMGAVAQDSVAVRLVNDSLTVRFVDADIRVVFQALGRYLSKPLLVGNIAQGQVTFETPAPIPRTRVQTLLAGLAAAQDLRLLEDSALFRVVSTAAAPSIQAPQTVPADVRFFVIRLKHARAADVAATVNQLFGGSGTFSGSSGIAAGTLTDELRRDAARALQPVSGDTARGQAAALQGPVTIVPDELTNALLVRATEQDFERLEEAVTQLDVRPLQVLIQVLIVEVRRDRAFSLGVDVAVTDVALGGGVTAAGTLAGGGLGQFALQVMKLESFELDATLRAAVSRGDARIVSRPVVVASNNREARILVGSQRPFVQVSRSLPTDTPTRDQVVQYRDVGTELTVLPTINADGYVSLLIQQEVNSATNETQFDAPVISTREAATTVLMRDGQTVVLGGLREQQHEVVKSGIPVLSALPILGGLFGSQERRTTETELFMFITPTVLSDDAQAAQAAEAALEQAERTGARVRPKP